MPPPLQPLARCFSTNTVARNHRALFYRQNGNPTEVLSVLSYPPLPEPAPGTVNIKICLAPINPADLNAIEGVYPSKHVLETRLNTSGDASQDNPVYVPGNEAVAQVTQVANDVTGLKPGDWVIMGKAQLGTWMSVKNVHHRHLIPVASPGATLTDVHLATIAVNPCTAYNMLHNFCPLAPGDWLIQNGANSAVGQAVIQIAAAKGYKTINLVRNRDNISELRKQLEELGADKVATYDDLRDLKQWVPEWTEGKRPRLALNCVGGKENDQMTRLLGSNGHLVTYGGMSKQPVTLPTSLFIFKNLTAHGYWQHQWNIDNASKRSELINTLIGLVQDGKLREPDHSIIRITENESDEQVKSKVVGQLEALAKGKGGKKLLLKFD